MGRNTFVIGLQWGDEGKGKIVDALVRDHDIVTRAQGGANAGHTIVREGRRYALHLLPVGVLSPDKECIVGNGVAFDPEVFLEELRLIRAQGFSVKGRLFVSDRAHLVFPYHRELDRLWEERPGAARIGTTKKGIGPCYADKVLRTTGIRVGELFHPAAFRERLRGVVDQQNHRLGLLRGRPMDARVLAERFLRMARHLRPFVCDTVALLHVRLKAGRRVLFEGAQGVMLDLDFGTYPYVTSSHTTVGGVCTGLGVPPKAVDRVLGLVKAYTTRVGEGPFPTELLDATGERLRSVGQEYGTTTGRPRRCGWLDAVQLRYAIAVNGVDALAVTKLDVLDGFEAIRICTGYRVGSRRLSSFPADASVLARAAPVYETCRGWQRPTGAARRLQDLPSEARAYLRRLSALCGAPIGMVSVGAESGAVIRVGAEAVA
jgi:adenylosuccinate synthase